MRRLSLTLAMAGLLSQRCAAADLVAVRPGVMCVGLDALAKLILPNGDSRSHGASPGALYVELAKFGECLDLKPGLRVHQLRAFHNTSSVVLADRPGPVYTIPNIDFSPAAEATGLRPAPPVADATSANTSPVQVRRPAQVVERARPATPIGYPDAAYMIVQSLPEGADSKASLEVLQDSRITPALRDQLWRSGRNTVDVPNAALAEDIARRPLLDAEIRLLSADGTVLAARKLGYKLATISAAALPGYTGSAFRLTIDETANRNLGKVVTEILLPAEHSLAPAGW